MFRVDAKFFLVKVKFGIFGDGKELPQVVMSHFFKDGDYRSGYYRDQTLLMSQNLLSAREIFAAVYGHPDKLYEKMSGGRQMAGHFLTNTIDENNNWIDQTSQKNHYFRYFSYCKSNVKTCWLRFSIKNL